MSCKCDKEQVENVQNEEPKAYPYEKLKNLRKHSLVNKINHSIEQCTMGFGTMVQVQQSFNMTKHELKWIKELYEQAGYEVEYETYTGKPFEALTPDEQLSWTGDIVYIKWENAKE